MAVMSKNLKKIIIILISVFLLGHTSPTQAQTPTPDWAAEKYSKISELNLAPGEIKKIKVGFYNRGSYNWRNTGKNYVSLYTYSPKYHASVLAAPSWLSSSHPTKLLDSLAGPNSKGYFELEIKAPKKNGAYKENFALAAENKTWIKGGQFEIVVKVGATENEKGNIEAETEDNAFLNPPKIEFEKKDFEAMKLSLLEPLTLNYGQEQTTALLIINKGKQNWNKRTLVLNTVSLAGTNTDASFSTTSWIDNNTVTEFSSEPIKKGQTEIYPISLIAPNRAGVFTLHFSLLVNGTKIEGGNFDLPVTVINPNPQENLTTTSDIIIDDPRMRIGLFTTEEPMDFVSTFEYIIQDTDNLELGRIIPGTKALISYNEETKKYSASWGEQTINSDKPLRLVPTDLNAYFTISNHELLARWGNNVNYNEFRDTFELRLAEKTGYVWVINELGMENYLKGMAEESDSSHKEFLKTMAVVERSYAYFNLKNPSKHAAGNFILDADYDQVYRGYVREKISPNMAAAIEETRGMIVTYNGEPADTPYFARSNGKTKSAKVVWGADKPWLQSVITPYDKGRTLWGHGVGMSARDGLYRAKDGATWDAIVKYYYTGVDLQKMY